MHRTVSLTLLLAALGGFYTLPAAAQELDRYVLDTTHAHIGFGVRHFGVSFVKGRFNKVTGEGWVNPENFSNSSFEVTIDAASIDTGFEARDEHLRGEEFFDVERFPAITFKSRKFTRSPLGLQIVGDLTVRDATHPVSFVVRAIGPRAYPFGMQRIGLGGTFPLDRREFGLRWSREMEDGTPFIGNEVRIELEVELFRPPAEDGPAEEGSEAGESPEEAEGGAAEPTPNETL